MQSARRALVTSVGLMLLRRKLQRRGGVQAAVGLAALDLLGPSVVRPRRLVVIALAVTVVGLVAVAGVWWWRRRSGPGSMPTSEDAAPADTETA